MNNIASRNYRSDVVHIVIDQHHVASTSDLFEPVIESLTVPVRKFACGPGGLVESVVLEREWDYRKDRLLFYAGCLPRVVKTLEDGGFTVVVEDHRLSGESLDICYGTLQSLTGRRRARLQAVLENSLGQVPIVSQEDARAFCGDVAACFPKARIAVAMGNKRDVRQYAEYLEHGLNEHVDVRHSSSQAGAVVARVSVSSFWWLPKEARIDILLLPFESKLLGEDAWEHIMKRRCDVGRRYALVPARRRLDAYDRWRLENIAGAVIVPEPRAYVEFAAVFLPVPNMRIHGTTTPQGLKRNLFVGNETRNRRVAEIAAALVQTPAATLTGLVPKAVAAQILARKDLRVAVLVESAEQARNLAAYLPQWRLCVARPDALHGLSEQSDAKHVIVTTTAAAKERIEADIVIRGTGTSSPLRRQDFRPVGGDRKRGEVLLVDFEDGYHKYAAKQARHRRTDYERCGIRVLPTRSIELDPIVSRIPARETSVLSSQWELHL